MFEESYMLENKHYFGSLFSIPDLRGKKIEDVKADEKFLEIKSKLLEIEGIGKQIHYNFVQVFRININHQLLHISNELILNMMSVSIRHKHVKDTLQESHQLNLAIVQQELALLNLSDIHHLVNQPQNTLRILLHQVIVA